MNRFDAAILDLDLEATAARLSSSLHDAVVKKLRRRGAIVAVSGGIDSACCLALACRALTADRVYALLLPERDSSSASTALGRALCAKLGVRSETVDIAPVLEALGCYRVREAAVRSVVPSFRPEQAWKIAMHGDRAGSDALNVFSVVVQGDDGKETRARLTPQAYAQIVAATNWKQRTRKSIEYFHADRLSYAVIGTPNRLEYDQGFFVKLGDGASDVKPIAGLYKTQVYALARHLGVIDEILARAPTTDTYSLAQGQDEFYFSLPYQQLDLLLYAKNAGAPIDDVARVLSMTTTQVQRVWDDIDQKRRTTAYLHAAPILLDDVDEIIRPGSRAR